MCILIDSPGCYTSLDIATSHDVSRSFHSFYVFRCITRIYHFDFLTTTSSPCVDEALRLTLLQMTSTTAISLAVAGRFLLSFSAAYEILKDNHLLSSPLTSFSRRQLLLLSDVANRLLILVLQCRREFISINTVLIHIPGVSSIKYVYVS